MMLRPAGKGRTLNYARIAPGRIPHEQDAVFGGQAFGIASHGFHVFRPDVFHQHIAHGAKIRGIVRYGGTVRGGKDPFRAGQLVAAFQIAQQLGTDAFTQRTAQQIGGKFLLRCGFEDV